MEGRSVVSTLCLIAMWAAWAAAANAEPFAYISNEDDDTVSIIDTAGDTVTGTIDVGTTPLGMAVNADATRCM